MKKFVVTVKYIKQQEVQFFIESESKEKLIEDLKDNSAESLGSCINEEPLEETYEQVKEIKEF